MTRAEQIRARAEKYSPIVEQYRNGKTLQECAQEAGVTKSGIQQIFAKMGITRLDGGAHASKQRRLAAIKQRSELRYRRMYGMSVVELDGLLERTRPFGIDPRAKYREQKRNSAQRGIAFRLTFTEWLHVWGDYLPLSGLGKGRAVMCRVGDCGAYELGNVFIGDAVGNLNAARDGHDFVIIRSVEEISCTVHKNSI